MFKNLDLKTFVTSTLTQVVIPAKTGICEDFVLGSGFLEINRLQL